MAVETVTVRRGGSYLTIPALALDRYMAKGYAQVDEHGEVIASGILNDAEALKKRCKEQEAEIAKLKEKIAQLEQAVAATKPTKQSKLFGTPVEEPTFEEVPDVKKSTSKKGKKTV